MSIEYRKQLEITGDYEVAVCGGGTAGFMAALTSARNGARTVMIERNALPGGTPGVNMVGPFMSCYDGSGKRQVIKGYYDELMRRMEKEGTGVHPGKVESLTPYAAFFPRNHDHVGPFDPEALKTTMFEMLREAGATVLLYTDIVDALMSGDRVEAVVVSQKEGLSALRANVFIDCTGDAIVSRAAGVECVQGRDSDGLTQPVSLFFIIEGVDDAKMLEYAKNHPEEANQMFNAGILEAEKAGKWSVPRRKIELYKMLNPGEYRINCARVNNIDPMNTAELTEAEFASRKQVSEIIAFLKDNIAGFEQVRLKAAGNGVGVRETLRIKGEYTLTLEDLSKATHFPDVIGLCGYPVDIHSPDGKDGGILRDLDVADVFEMPYRILVPQKVDNLLVAGRCVSATHEALGAIRVMPPVFAMAQAAGIAAVMALRGGYRPRDVDVGELQDKLRASGAILE